MVRRGKFTVVFMSFLYALGAYGQDVQRQVLYETSTTKCFKVDCEVEVEQLSSLDWVSLQAKPPIIKQAEFVIADNWLTMIHIYPQQPRYERDYEFKMGKSVTDRSGTRLYNHQGEEYYYMPTEENRSLFISDEMINAYGVFKEVFSNSAEKIAQIEAMADAGLMPKIYILGSKVLMIHDTIDEEEEKRRMEFEIDFEQLSIENRLFVNDIHVLTDRTEHQQTYGGFAPIRKKTISYSELPSGFRYQITEIETYLSYKVINEKEEIIVDMKNNPFDIEITPNPADEYITINFSIPIDGQVSVKILDLEDVVMWEDENVHGRELGMDINFLPPSMYTVLCTYNNETARGYFLKDGVGQYNSPNPTNINIQVFPNPAGNYLEILFPTATNEEMDVRIMDAMNNSYIQGVYPVANNVLRLDVNSLPTGIYYIVCIDNNGTACAKFIKQ
jgi:hypothetical protein